MRRLQPVLVGHEVGHREIGAGPLADDIGPARIGEVGAGGGEVDINARTDLTPSEKRAALKDLEKQEEELYRDAIEAFK